MVLSPSLLPWKQSRLVSTCKPQVCLFLSSLIFSLLVTVAIRLYFVCSDLAAAAGAQHCGYSFIYWAVSYNIHLKGIFLKSLILTSPELSMTRIPMPVL